MKKIIIFAILLSVLASCKKDKTCDQNMAGVSGTYRVTAITYKASASAAEQDFYTIIFADACQRDDRFVFNANGTYVLTDAGVKCVPAGDDSGTWSISGNTGDLDGDPITVQSFNCSAWVVILADYNVTGDQLKVTFTRQ